MFLLQIRRIYIQNTDLPLGCKPPKHEWESSVELFWPCKPSLSDAFLPDSILSVFIEGNFKVISCLCRWIMRWSSVGKRCWGKRERNRRHLVCSTQLITQWTRHSAPETRQARKKLVLGKKKCYHTSKYSSQFHTDLHTCGGIGAGAGSFQLYANMCVIIPICLPKGLPMLQGDADKWALLRVTLQFPRISPKFSASCISPAGLSGNSRNPVFLDSQRFPCGGRKLLKFRAFELGLILC